MAARRSILCHQETRKVLRPCFVCMKEGLQERFSLVQMQGQKQGYSTGIQISALWVLGRTPARTALACWTRKGRGQAEIHLSGRADAAAELPVVLSPLPLGTPTLCCKSQRQTVQLKKACTGTSPGDLHPNIKALLTKPET